MSSAANARRPARGLDRLADANANRAAEGLRVLEDIARLLLDDATLASEAKHLRHAVRAAMPAGIAADRDTPGDVGTAITATGEYQRTDLAALIRANAARIAEALRTIEETAKLDAVTRAATCEALRYRCYALESALLARLPGQRLRQVRLYALVDASLCADPVAVAAAVTRGGAGCVQLRAKALVERAYRDLAARVADAVRSAGGLFAVNDHAGIARLLDADALHLGQDDLRIADARAIVGPRCALGLSTHTPEQIAAAQTFGADYLGVGPVFATQTKPHEPERGADLLATPALRHAGALPWFAIGGLTLERVRELAAAGSLAHGVAIGAGLCRAEDPERAAAAFLAALDGR